MENNLQTEHVEQLFQEAVILQESKRFSEAVNLFEYIIKIKPDHCRAMNELGVLFCLNGDVEKGSHLFENAILVDESIPDFHNNLGNSLKNLGHLKEAARCYEKALAIKQDSVSAINNLGIVNLALGNLEQAEALFKRAICLGPDIAEIENNLGVVKTDLGKFDGALASYLKSIEKDPGYYDPYINMADLLTDMGEYNKAVTYYKVAVNMKRDDKSVWQRYVYALSKLPFTGKDNWLEKEIFNCLGVDGVNKEDAVGCVIRMMFGYDDFYQMVSRSLEHVEDDGWFGLIEKYSLLPLTRPIFLKIMESAVITEPSVEILLTKIRRELLYLSFKKGFLEGLTDNVFRFVLALAHQCFLNEYVYFETEEEKKLISTLKEQVDHSLDLLQENAAPCGIDAVSRSERQLLTFVIKTALLGAYIPLYKLTNAPGLFNLPYGKSWFRSLILRQVVEPVREMTFLKNIPKLTEINEDLSGMIRLQYEENPYPRWENPTVMSPCFVGEQLGELFPEKRRYFALIPHEPEILVAGCGTGKEAIEYARAFKNCKVLAVDLSAASLAFGHRKARELDINNIYFAQADIMAFNGFDPMFDVVECVGVLNLLRDPDAGFKVLAALVKPGGFMKIGLYTKKSGDILNSVKKHNGFSGYKPVAEDIRRFRRNVLISDTVITDDDVYKKDFFTTSSCRDLFFNSRDQGVALTDIKTLARGAQFEFLGFEDIDKTILKSFKERFPHKDDLYDLDSWDAYETEHPDTFKAMYTFWMRKPLNEH